MRIVDIREERVSIASSIRNSYIDFGKMDVSVVAVTTDVQRHGNAITGYGFSSNGRYSQGDILRRRVIPRILAADSNQLMSEDGSNLDPVRVWDVMMTNEKPGGHGERSVAVAVIDMALWDIVAKVEDLPLDRLLAERYGTGSSSRNVPVYAAGGYYYPGASTEKLKTEMQSYLDLGYSRVKMKIGGADLDTDLRRLEAVLEVVGEGARVAVDANGRFGLDRALTYAEALLPYDLMWFEEAGDPLDYNLQAQVSSAYSKPMATGENLFSMQDTRNLLRYGGMRRDRDVLQMDPALSYGLVEYLRTLRALEAEGWSASRCVPHGGHQFGLGIAAGLGLGGNESYPGLFAPFGGFADDTPVQDGFVRPTDVPGVGFEGKAGLMHLFNEVFS